MDINVENFVGNFIESLGFKDECKGLAKVLLTNEEECREFYIGYYGKNTYAINDLVDYREKKIAIADMSFDKFTSLCDNEGMKEAFEKTFLQSFNLHQIGFIEQLIDAGATSLKEIHSLFVKQPNENILKHVL